MQEMDFNKITGFEWDKGNRNKSAKKHKIGNQEAEEPFFCNPQLVVKDKIHSTKKESRWHLYGVTKASRKLFIVFTIREKKIRIISARPMRIRTEGQIYLKYAK
jgi:hypothetical protein